MAELLGYDSGFLVCLVLIYNAALTITTDEFLEGRCLYNSPII